MTQAINWKPTCADIVEAVETIFDDLIPDDPEAVDADLRSMGYDPDEIGAKIKRIAREAMVAAGRTDVEV